MNLSLILARPAQWLLSLALLAVINSAQSSVQINNNIRLDGFLSVGAGVLSDSDVEIADYDEDVSFSPDSIIGLQLTSRINDSTDATVQLVSRGSETFETEAAWAYLTYHANPKTSIRFGRLRTPHFYYSDFLEVGYAYHWIRPPTDVYRLDIVSSLNGVDVTRRFNMGQHNGYLQAFFGRVKRPFDVTDPLTGNQQTINLELENFVGLVAGLEIGQVDTRISAQSVDVNFESPNGTVLFDGDRATFYDIAASWNPSKLGFITEYNIINFDSPFIPDDTAYMLGATYQLNALTPHLTFTGRDSDTNGPNNGSDSIIAGVRYDYDVNSAIKFEIQHSEVSEDGSTQSGQLYSVAVDVIF